MNDVLKRVGRGATVVLTSTMLLVAVVKAQGCKNEPPPSEAPVAEPAAPNPGTTGPADAGTDPRGRDSGAAQRPEVGGAAAQPVEAFDPTKFLPTSKSGSFEFDRRSTGGMGLMGTSTNAGEGIGDVLERQKKDPKPAQRNQAPE